MSIARIAATLAVGLLTGGAAAQSVHRCEGADGRVTYANAPCPAGTRTARTVNTEPPVRSDDATAAKARAKRDAAEVRQVEKERDEAEKAAQRSKRAAIDQQQQKLRNRRCEDARREVDKARLARERAALTPAQMKTAEAAIEKLEKRAASACQS